ncbi:MULTISPECIES: YaaW family protein [Pseudoalteromonas]|jgi:uncharacterized protein YaaW (UPF0174 family)|uniref:DUF3944 domain-containing protein n=1 Tax=Pseudoalteromonas sp. MT33b TaxID=2759705 RepID=UPI0015F8195D|nr:DUF3944 domain-containing protein [Pseudoalteromonas sp. MT33b]QMW16842.1 DUF3944 domain-containing protein [Pseudoalteromonas sp. MT33b]
MSHKYREDKDLAFLHYADTEMLEVLVKHLIFDKDGEKRNTESLSGDKAFIDAKGDYSKIWKSIAAELQHYGGDTLVNLIRRTGVTYREILIDVCERMKVKTDFDAATIEIEKAMFAKLIESSWEKMTDEQKKELTKELQVDPKLAGPAAMAAIIAAIKLGGFASYKIALIVANSIARMIMGKGLQLAANAGIARTIGIFAGPIGWAINVLITVPAITGPAFRVTLPAVIQVAAMRQQLENKDFF